MIFDLHVILIGQGRLFHSGSPNVLKINGSKLLKELQKLPGGNKCNKRTSDPFGMSRLKGPLSELDICKSPQSLYLRWFWFKRNSDDKRFSRKEQYLCKFCV